MARYALDLRASPQVYHDISFVSVDPAQFGAVGYRHRPVYFRTTAGAPGGRRSISTQTLESAIKKSASVQDW